MKYTLVVLLILACFSFACLSFVSIPATSTIAVAEEDYLCTVIDFYGTIEFGFSLFPFPFPQTINGSGQFFTLDECAAYGDLVSLVFYPSDDSIIYTYKFETDLDKTLITPNVIIDVSEYSYSGFCRLTIEPDVQTPVEPPAPTYHNVSFYDGETLNLLKTLTIEQGKSLSESHEFLNDLKFLEKDGYDFKGWFLDDFQTALNENAPITYNMHFYAVFIEIPVIPIVTLTFFVEGNPYATFSVEKGQPAQQPADPFIEGKIFTVWEDVFGNEFNFKNTLEESISLYAVFEPIKVHILFYLDEDTPITTQEYEYNDFTNDYSLTEIPEGFNFIGWSLSLEETDCFIFGNQITSDIKLYAILEKITFKINYYVTKDSLLTSIDYNYNEVIECITTKPNKLGHIFLGWSLDPDNSTLYEFGEPAKCSLNLYAVFEPIKVYILFYLNEDTPITTQEYEYNDFTNDYSLTEIPEGFNFIGWSLSLEGTDCFIFGNQITSDIKLYAILEKITFKVNYYVTKDKLLTSLDYEYNEVIESISTIPSDPAFANHDFLGWTLSTDDNILFEFGQHVITNLDLYAVFKLVTYNIYYYENGVMLDWDWLRPTIDKNQILEAVAFEQRLGYTFRGWFTNSDCDILYSFSTPVTSDVELYCYYELNKYSINVQIDAEIELTVVNQAYFGDSVDYSYTFAKGRKLDMHMVIKDLDGEEIELDNNTFIMPASDITIILTISPDMYTLILKSEYFDDIIVSYSQSIYPEITPPEDKVFIAWYLDELLTEEYNGVIYGEEYEEIYLYPMFVARYYSLTVLGNIESFSQIIEYSTRLNASEVVVVALDGYEVISYYYDEEYENEFTTDIVYSNLTLYAKCRLIEISITFMYGSYYEKVYVEEVLYGYLPKFIDMDSYDYLRFISWNEELEPVKTERSYYAVYQTIYDNYYMHEGSLVIKTKGVFVVEPNTEYIAPIKEGHEFTGFSFSHNSGHINYYEAQFSPLMYAVIKDNDAGGELVSRLKYEYGEEVSILVNIKNGYLLVNLSLNPNINYSYSDSILAFTMPAYEVVITLRTQSTATQTEDKPIPTPEPVPLLELQLSIGSLIDNEKIKMVADLNDVVGGVVLFGTKQNENPAQSVDMLLYNKGAEVKQSSSITISLTNTYNGQTKELDFKSGSTIEVMVEVEKISVAGGYYKVLMQKNGQVTFYSCKVVEREGKTYVSFNADRTGEYIISLLQDLPQARDSSGIYLVSTITLLVICVVLVFILILAVRVKRHYSKY